MRVAILLSFCAVAVHGQTSAPASCDRVLAEDFVPVSTSERLAYAAGKVFGPSAWVLSAAQAGITQWMDRPHEWGQGGAGFGRRYGSGFAQRIVGQTVEQGMGWALHEDTRYFASGRKGFRTRFWYAIESTFLARHDDGTRGFAYSVMGGTAAGAFIPRAWQPPSTSGFSDGVQTFGVTLAVRAGFNVAREFGPRFVGKSVR